MAFFCFRACADEADGLEPVMTDFKKFYSTILLVLAVMAGGAVHGNVLADEPERAVAESRQESSEQKGEEFPVWFPRILGAQYNNIYQYMPPFHSPYQGGNSLSFRNGLGNQVTQVYGAVSRFPIGPGATGVCRRRVF